MREQKKMRRRKELDVPTLLSMYVAFYQPEPENITSDTLHDQRFPVLRNVPGMGGDALIRVSLVRMVGRDLCDESRWKKDGKRKTRG